MLSNNNRSKKQQAYIDYYENLWASTDGGDFEKSFVLFSDYCGYGLEGWDYVTATAGGHYTKTIYAIIHKYHQNYFSRSTLAFSTGYLLAAIGSRIRYSKTPLGFEGRMAAIFEVIKNHTQLDIQNFMTGHWYRGCSDMSFVCNPHGEKWVSVLVNHASKETISNIWLALDSKIFDSLELISCLMLTEQSGLSKYWCSAGEILDIVNEKISLSENEIKNLFSQALKTKNYEIALYLFFKRHVLNLGMITGIPDFCGADKDDRPIYRAESMLKIISEAIFKPINGDLLPELMDHMLAYGRKWIAHSKNCEDGSTPKFLELLSNKKQFITGWYEIEEKIRACFKPDYNRALYFSITLLRPPAIEGLLKDHQLDITTACWYAKAGFFEIPNPYQREKGVPVNVYHPSLLEANEENVVKMTPLMGLIHMGELVFSGGCQDVKHRWEDFIRALIAYNPSCVLTKDSKGRNVCDYLQALKQVVISAPWWKGEEEKDIQDLQVIEGIIGEINEARNKMGMNNLFTLFQLKNDRNFLPSCDIPQEIYVEVMRKIYQG
jgi:hypothetical protein